MTIYEIRAIYKSTAAESRPAQDHITVNHIGTDNQQGTTTLLFYISAETYIDV